MIDYCKPGERLSDMVTIGIEEFKGTLFCRVELVKEGGKWIYYYDEDVRPIWMSLEANGQRTEIPMTK